MLRNLYRTLPLLLFMMALTIGGLVYGVYAGYRQIFPYSLLRAATLTGRQMYMDLGGAQLTNDIGFIRFEDGIPATQITAQRVIPKHAIGSAESYLLTGGPGQFLDICPQNGCLAVEMSRFGKVLHAWPFRPEDFRKTALVNRPREGFSSDPASRVYSAGLAQLPGGDLIAVFFRSNSFPDGGGIARIGKDGHFVWFRNNYAHHWPSVSGNEIFFPLTALREGVRPVLAGGEELFEVGCPWKYYAGEIEIADLSGKIKDHINVLDALLASPYRFALWHTWEKCDPLHINSVVPVGGELAQGLAGVAPEDLLISMRHISALGIIGRRDHKFKRIFFGPFFGQHSAKPLHGTKVLLFDNLGGEDGPSSSRLLEFDLENSALRTIFPASGARAPLFSLRSGTVDIASDGTRAIVTATEQGQAYEVSIADGQVLTVFNNVHPVPGGANKQTSMRSAYFQSYGIYYSLDKGVPNQ